MSDAMDCPVDWVRFRDLAVGEEGLRDVVTFYLAYAAEQLEAMRAAIAGGSVETVERLAHATAGSSATAGATALVPALLQLEQLAHAGCLDGATDLVDQAAAAFERVRECLVDELGPLDVTG